MSSYVRHSSDAYVRNLTSSINSKIMTSQNSGDITTRSYRRSRTSRFRPQDEPEQKVASSKSSSLVQSMTKNFERNYYPSKSPSTESTSTLSSTEKPTSVTSQLEDEQEKTTRKPSASKSRVLQRQKQRKLRQNRRSTGVVSKEEIRDAENENQTKEDEVLQKQTECNTIKNEFTNNDIKKATEDVIVTSKFDSPENKNLKNGTNNVDEKLKVSEELVENLQKKILQLNLEMKRLEDENTTLVNNKNLQDENDTMLRLLRVSR